MNDAAPSVPSPSPEVPAPAAGVTPGAAPPVGEPVTPDTSAGSAGHDADADLDPLDPRRLARGQGAFLAGALGLPLGLGVVAGYWASDRGVRWLPTMLSALIALGAVSLLLMLLGSVWVARAQPVPLPTRGVPLTPAQRRRRGRKRIVGLTLLLLLAAVARVVLDVAARPCPLTTLAPAAFQRTFELDAQRYRELDASLARVVALLEAQDATRGQASERVLSQDEEALFLDAWESYLNTALALDQVRSFYEDYYRLDLSRLERGRHVRSFLLTFAAELSLYENTAQVVTCLERNPHVVTFLNEAGASRGLPRDGVAVVKADLVGVRDLSRVQAGQRYLAYLDAVHDVSSDAEAGGYAWLWREVERHVADVSRRRASELAALTVAGDFGPLERGLKRLTFPVQSSVAEWMGDTRVRRAGTYLITAPQLEAMSPQLRPGDVMLSRKNWYLSNVALPGFWPHAILYVGTDEQLRAAFDADPEVLAWVRRQAGRDLTFTQYLAGAFPAPWRERQLLSTTSFPAVVIEAISEGVVQNSLHHAAGDYLAALRPRLPAWVRAQAVARAFAYLGRPYDFDFDFATDHALVCSELVWRSYRPVAGGPGLDWPALRVAGRMALPSNEIARRFAERAGRPDAELDFVYFLDGREREGRAVVADAAAFARSHARLKWDVVQE